MHRRLLHVGVLLLALAPGMQSQSPQPSPHEIDLEKIGYPARCDYLFQDKDAYEKRHVEFLDSERLLISFPLHTSACNKNNQPPAEKYRSVIIDTAGRLLHSLDWLPGENVQAGPDGHILMSSGWEIRILDSDFSVLQRIEWVDGEDPQRKPMKHWAWYVVTAPSRHGFVVGERYPPYRAAYFEGNPARQAVAAESCGSEAVSDGGFACAEASKEQLDIHLSDSERNIHDPLLRKASAAMLPNPQTVLVLTDKLRLDLLNPPEPDEEIADLRWLAPGQNSGFRWDLASGTARRILFFSHGVRFPLTDTSGFGYYLRVAVVDVASKTIAFRGQYPIDSDVAISPMGTCWRFARRPG